MDLDQSIGRMRRPVPVVRPGRIHAEELPDGVSRGANLFGRHGAGQRDITLCLEMLEILGGENFLSRERLRRHALTFSSIGIPSSTGVVGPDAGWNAATVELVTRIEDNSGRTSCSKSAYRFLKHQL